MKVAAKGTRSFIDHVALAGVLNAAGMDVSQEAPDVTCFSDAGPRALVGNYGHAHSLSGFFDGSSSNIDALGSTLLGSTEDHYICQAFAGVSEGSICYESLAQLTGEPIKTAVGGAVLLDLALAGAGGLARSHVIAQASALATTTGLLTSVDRGAATTAGTFQAVFRALSGTFTNAILALQESTNNTTWSAASTLLTATFTAPGVSRVTSTATIAQYVRATATTIAGGTAEVLVTGGVVAGTSN